MSDIQNKIINIIAITMAISFFCFASSWILFEFKGSSNSLKDTWSIVSSLFSGGAALIAAYIASLLFNDWKEQHNKSILSNEAKIIFRKISESYLLLATYNKSLDRMLGNSVAFSINDIHNSMEPLVSFNQEIIVDLKYFEDLSSESKLNNMIKAYNNLVSQHVDYLDSYIKCPDNKLISEDFVSRGKVFTSGLNSTSQTIQSNLKEYILFKDILK
ncbi:hypothetical protein MST16_08905 [Acinetobacter sp. YH16040_T]|uniref:hypothetical protein n=1 Tax=unclassified Acinetobacter TaxID=196816 RepID=UPI0015D220C8|nr:MULTISPECIES: hypothetical protein [unclassified Acinetobacter]UUS56246.1 hypothetical protein MST16_08905 [Acinetobacter sp. YH16040_T]